jgi:tRNA(Ile)-lysidine synthase
MKNIEIALRNLSGTLKHDKPIVIALSGGVDSVVLASMANQILQPGQRLLAIHVHHGLSQNADAWAQFLEKMCLSMNIELKVCRVTLNKRAGDSLEDVARKARYEALFSESPEGSQILLAHHLDDQLETMLIALKRGAGALRMRGMAPMSIDDSGRSLIRPLLEVQKTEILAYASAKGLEWIEDESNQDSCFDRNFLRHEIIPLLKKRWEGILTATKRTARILNDENEIVEIHAKQLLEKVTNNAGDLVIDELKKLAPVEIRLVIRHWVISSGVIAPREDKTMLIYNEVALAKQGQKPNYKITGARIVRNKGCLQLLRD